MFNHQNKIKRRCFRLSVKRKFQTAIFSKQSLTRYILVTLIDIVKFLSFRLSLYILQKVFCQWGWWSLVGQRQAHEYCGFTLKWNILLALVSFWKIYQSNFFLSFLGGCFCDFTASKLMTLFILAAPIKSKLQNILKFLAFQRLI